MPMLDPRKQASALDAVERQHPQYASLVATLAKEYGFDRKGRVSKLPWVVNGVIEITNSSISPLIGRWPVSTSTNPACW